MDKLPYVLGLIAFVGAVAAGISKPNQSPDLYSYLGYGRKFAYLNMDPYTPMRDALWDPVIASLPKTWLDFPCHYGPTSVLIFAFLNITASAQTQAAILFSYKMGWIAFYVFFSLLCALLFRKNGPYGLTRWMALCANPVNWVQCLREGHLEVVMLPIMALSIITVQRRLWFATGFMLALLCTTKITSLILVPFFVWQAFRKEGDEAGMTQRCLRVVHLLLGLIPYFIGMYIWFDGGELRELVQFNAMYEHSPQVVGDLLGRLEHMLPISLFIEDKYYKIGIMVITVLGLAAIFLNFAFSRTRQNLSTTLAAAMIWFNLTLTYYYCWYIYWGLFYLFNGMRSRKAIVITGILYAFFFSVHEATAIYSTEALLVSIGLVQLVKMLRETARPPGYGE